MRRSRALLSALLFLLPVSCSIAGNTQEAEDAVVMVLFDLSRSTLRGDIREQYLADFRTIVDAVDEGGILVADVIRENPLAQSRLPIQETFEPFDPTAENRLTYRERVEGQRERVLSQAQSLLASGQEVAGTGIIDSLSVVERVFNTYGDAQAQYLVVFSDMVEVSGALDFSRMSAPEIARLPQSGAVADFPDLSGVRVYVSGAGSGAAGALQPEKFRAIQSFWLWYFSRAGADLPAERYGAALITFP